MTRALRAFVLVCAIGCRPVPTETQPAELASLRFDIPVGWQSVETSTRGVITAVWTPQMNERHESLSILRSVENPALTSLDGTAMQRLLVDAQRALPRARPSAVMATPRPHNLVGWRIDVDFVPAGMTAHYRRAHAVFIDGQDHALVHVLYTAKDPDLETFNLVVASIRHEEG